MRNFRELLIWQRGMEIVKSTYEIANELPAYEKFGLVSQIARAAVSIPSNIAEGCAKSSQKEFGYFLQIALGSSYELETQLQIIKDLSWARKIGFTNHRNHRTKKKDCILYEKGNTLNP